MSKKHNNHKNNTMTSNMKIHSKEKSLENAGKCGYCTGELVDLERLRTLLSDSPLHPATNEQIAEDLLLGSLTCFRYQFIIPKFGAYFVPEIGPDDKDFRKVKKELVRLLPKTHGILVFVFPVKSNVWGPSPLTNGFEADCISETMQSLDRVRN